jgi:hypothetical protein
MGGTRAIRLREPDHRLVTVRRQATRCLVNPARGDALAPHLVSGTRAARNASGTAQRLSLHIRCAPHSMPPLLILMWVMPTAMELPLAPGKQRRRRTRVRRPLSPGSAVDGHVRKRPAIAATGRVPLTARSQKATSVPAGPNRLAANSGRTTDTRDSRTAVCGWQGRNRVTQRPV